MAITLSPRLLTLGRYLAGEFDNQAQSLAEPAWFVHLRVWYRPVKLFVEDSLTFFIEQVSVTASQPPYRQRLLRLVEDKGQLKGQFYGFREPLRFRGGGTAPELLAALCEADLVHLPTCHLDIVEVQAGSAAAFKAALPPGTLCSFGYDDKTGDNRTGYVSLGFEIGPDPSSPAKGLTLKVYDKGVDPDTGKGLWGALMGPFCLVKQVDFSPQLPR